jgi:DNA mismatch endonuclease (patch repair protein)
MKRTPEQTSHIMKQIKCKDSEIEKTLRKELWSRGIRYRKNAKDVYGKPDLVFKSKKVAVFCDSEFWHGFEWEQRKQDFKINKEYWIPKIERNMRRDIEVNNQLQKEGWIVLRFWGQDIMNSPSACADKIETILAER